MNMRHSNSSTMHTIPGSHSAVPLNDRVLGTCSKCGGAVTVPKMIWSTVQPVPTCTRCGATPKQRHGPVIDME